MAIVRVRKDVMLLRDKRDMDIIMVCKDVSLLRQMGSWLK